MRRAITVSLTVIFLLSLAVVVAVQTLAKIQLRGNLELGPDAGLGAILGFPKMMRHPA